MIKLKNKKYFFDFIKKPNDSFFINSFIDYNIDIFRICNENSNWGFSTMIITSSTFSLYYLITKSIKKRKNEENNTLINKVYKKLIKEDYDIDKYLYKFKEEEDKFYLKHYINKNYLINQFIFSFLFLNHFRSLSYILNNSNEFINLDCNFLFLNGFCNNDLNYELTPFIFGILLFNYFKTSPNPLYFRLNKNIDYKTNFYLFTACFTFSLPIYFMPNGYFISSITILIYKILVNIYKKRGLKLKLYISEQKIRRNNNKIKKLLK